MIIYKNVVETFPECIYTLYMHYAQLYIFKLENVLLPTSAGT